jgi:hypothetical protein
VNQRNWPRNEAASDSFRGRWHRKGVTSAVDFRPKNHENPEEIVECGVTDQLASAVQLSKTSNLYVTNRLVALTRAEDNDG